MNLERSLDIWRALQRAGASVVYVRYDRALGVASAIVEYDGDRATANGYDLGHALKRCAARLGIAFA